MADELTALGHYHITRTLGQGSMGTVYLAGDQRSMRQVALKVLDPSLLRDPTAISRINLANLPLVLLEHPNIMPVYEVGEINGQRFMVMPYYEQGSLKRRLVQNGPMAYADAVQIIDQIANALDFGHARGDVHGGVNPSNIFVTDVGHAVLADYGLTGPVESLVIARSRMDGATETLAYMAPEVHAEGKSTQSSDIYALACVCYEMLTGKALFARANPRVTVLAHKRQRMFTREWPEGVPAAIRVVFEKALSVDADARYSSASAFVNALYALKPDLAREAPDQTQPAPKIEAFAPVETRQDEKPPALESIAPAERSDASSTQAPEELDTMVAPAEPDAAVALPDTEPGTAEVEEPAQVEQTWQEPVKPQTKAIPVGSEYVSLLPPVRQRQANQETRHHRKRITGIILTIISIVVLIGCLVFGSNVINNVTGSTRTPTSTAIPIPNTATLPPTPAPTATAMLILPTSSSSQTTIPFDSTIYNGHAYKIFTSVPNTSRDAQSYCESMGGSLATISSSEENQFLFTLMKSIGLENAYFGYSDAIQEGVWVWVDGTHSSYTNWHSGEPNGENSGEDYAMFYWKFSDGTWNDGDFGGSTDSGQTNFICEWDPEDAASTTQIPATLTSTPTHPTVPSDATVHNGHAYKIITNTPNNWSDAQSFCELMGGSLATISSSEENYFLFSLMKSDGLDNAYFGFSDASEEGIWVWVDGSNSSYSNWHPGEPNGENSREDYAMFYWKFSDGTWNDGDFGGSTNRGQQNYICEWDRTD